MKYKFRKEYSSRELKKQIITGLEKELKTAKSIILFRSEKVTHQEFETLRKKLKTTSSKLQFVKNTLFRVVAKKLGLPEKLSLDEIIKGPTALISVQSEDFVAPIKLLKEQFAKNENVTIKIALLDSDIYESTKVMEFANIPSKQELYTKLVGSLKSPLYKLSYALNYNVQKLVIAIKGIASSKKE